MLTIQISGWNGRLISNIAHMRASTTFEQFETLAGSKRTPSATGGSVGLGAHRPSSPVVRAHTGDGASRPLDRPHKSAANSSKRTERYVTLFAGELGASWLIEHRAFFPSHFFRIVVVLRVSESRNIETVAERSESFDIFELNLVSS